MHATLKVMMKNMPGATDVVDGLGGSSSQASKRGLEPAAHDRDAESVIGDEQGVRTDAAPLRLPSACRLGFGSNASHRSCEDLPEDSQHMED